jgi:ABC-type transport system involved in multi-copper enzyme maturation permease subunit
MAFVQSGTAWLRQKVNWSGSRQSWEERLGALLLLIGAACVLWFGGRLSAVQQVLVWGLLLLAAAVLLRRGWLKLFGPVLFYDMIRSARRGRYFLIRMGYAALLLFFLFSVWINTRPVGFGNDRQQAAALAENFFETFMAVQLLTVALLTPAYVAGAIADEKDRKTLEFLLATDLRNREIVLSKLVARLANLALFVLTGLPILSLIQFLGGVDPNLVLAGFAVTALTMAGLGGLSILNSTYFKKPRDAIALTYLGMVAYLAVSFLLLGWQRVYPGPMSLPVWLGTNPLNVGDLVDAFNAGNLLIVMGHIAEAGARGSLATDIPRLLWHYSLFHGLVAVGLTTWAVVRVRAVALKQAQGTPRRGLAALRLWKRPPVASPPMVWKEVFVEGGIRFSWLGWIMVAVLLVATFLPAGLIIYEHFDDLLTYWSGGFVQDQAGVWRIRLYEMMNIYVRMAGTVVACLTLLAVAVRASTSIGGERDRQTLDALLTSPLDSDAILFGKWLGAILSVRWAWIWLLLIWGLGVLTGGLHLMALPLLIGAWLVFAAFLATLGLWFSMVCRTTLRATVGTLITTAVISVGHWLPWFCCGPFLAVGGGSAVEFLVKFQAGLTPPAVLGVLAFRSGDLDSRGGGSDFASWLGFSLFGLFVWMIITVGLGVALSNNFRVMTGRNRYRYPDGRNPEPRPRRLPTLLREAPAPVEPPRPSSPAFVKGAILVEEAWEKPREPPRGVDVPPEGPS